MGDSFPIPEHNASIRFAANGSYSSADLENGYWLFRDLSLNNSNSFSNFRVSAENCNVTIISCRTYNFSGTLAQVRYNVTGFGKQSFNVGIAQNGAQWIVYLNGKLMGENNGYFVLSDSTITVTAATLNATLSYFNLNAFGGPPDTSKQPFYVQHSVSIWTAVVFLVGLASFILIKKTVRKSPYDA